MSLSMIPELLCSCTLILVCSTSCYFYYDELLLFSILLIVSVLLLVQDHLQVVLRIDFSAQRTNLKIIYIYIMQNFIDNSQGNLLQCILLTCVLVR